MKISRYSVFWTVLVGFIASVIAAVVFDHSVWWLAGFGTLFAVGVYDRVQKKHSILRNYPIIGHFRYLIEYIRPELRQYIVESDTEKTPFSRQQRSIVYQRAKGDPDVQSFGTKIDVSLNNHEWVNHSMTPTKLPSSDFRVVIGNSCKKPYAMSLLNISAMSFGSLSANAIRALNKGAKMGGFAQDTGEGSVSNYHREHGGDLIWEIGSGYFGCRTATGAFDPEKFAKVASEDQIKMIEIKLSQGAKPGHGGVLPAAKVTPEISETRGVPMGEDCISPASHSAFSTPVELIKFIEQLRELSGGKPVGFKLCVGHPWELFAICKAMVYLNSYPDFIVIDGSEGGTGAAPMEFTDHVGAPLQEGLQLVHNTLVGLGIRDKIKLGASGKLITAFDIAKTLALGADWVNSARGFLFSLGCVQALSCSTGHCPTGIATQDPERQKALIVEDKAVRVYNFHKHTMHAFKELLQAAGLKSPTQLKPYHIVRRVSGNKVELLANLLESVPEHCLRTGMLPDMPVFQNWWGAASPHSFDIQQCPVNLK